MSNTEAPKLEGQRAQDFVARPEPTQTPEIWRPDFGLIVISGPPGAGTSTTAVRLAAECGIIPNLYKAGDTVREMRENNERAPGFISRNKTVDKKVDRVVAQMVLNASLVKPSIAEAQIGGVTALRTQKEAERENKFIQAPVIRILLWAREEVRDQRLYLAALRKGEKATPEGIIERTRAREKGDQEHWRSIYPDLGNDNPHNMNSRDKDGNKFYNLEFDNSDQNEEEAYRELTLELKRLGYLRPKF